VRPTNSVVGAGLDTDSHDIQPVLPPGTGRAFSRWAVFMLPGTFMPKSTPGTGNPHCDADVDVRRWLRNTKRNWQFNAI
jgi:hypothetical protein